MGDVPLARTLVLVVNRKTEGVNRFFKRLGFRSLGIVVYLYHRVWSGLGLVDKLGFFVGYVILLGCYWVSRQS